MDQALSLQAHLNAPIRKATRSELVQCQVGIFICVSTLVLAIVFMVADVFWQDGSFGSVLGIPSWQVANYVLNAFFSVLGVLIARNIASLYRSTQRWLLAPMPGRPGRIPATGLAAPEYSSRYFLSLLRDKRRLPLVITVILVSPSFSAVVLFLLDFKLRTYSYTTANYALPINSILPSADPNSTFPFGAWGAQATDEWSSLSSLVLSTTLASLAPTVPLDTCLYGFTCIMPLYPNDPVGNLDIIQFSGTTFNGLSSYGFSATVNGYWGFSVSSGNSQPFALSSTQRIQRRAFGQSSDFVCQPLQYTNISAPIILPGTESTSALTRHDIFTDGPCFSRNSTFVMDQADLSARFDVQACNSDSELQLQFVVFQPQSSIEAYSCSSTVAEGYAWGVQTSPNIVTVSPLSDGVEVLPASTLRQYTDNLNVYFGLASYPLSNATTQASAGFTRLQGDWASVPRYNWPSPPRGNVPAQDAGGQLPFRFDSRNFTAAYANALVAGLGTFFTTGMFYSVDLGDSPDVYDIVEKQVVQLGAPVAAGVPLLSVIVVLLLAHGALWWLCRQELLALNIADGVEMLMKVEVRDQGMPKVAELCMSAETSEIELVSSLPLLYRRAGGEGRSGGNGKERDNEI